jgi:hypothetical protein
MAPIALIAPMALVAPLATIILVGPMYLMAFMAPTALVGSKICPVVLLAQMARVASMTVLLWPMAPTDPMASRIYNSKVLGS